jgi:hypothetical protein
VVSGAVAAVLHGDGEDEPEQAARRTPSPDLPDPSSDSHEFDADYTGPVWITVDANDATPRNVLISWGDWQRPIVHQTADPVSYEFTKERAETAVTNAPAMVEVEPSAEVTFHQGDPPNDAIDVNEDWIEVVTSTTTTTVPAG